MKRAVGYLRVSKEEEETENQRMAIEHFAEEEGFTVVRYFSDEDVSGWKVPAFKRPGFTELLEFCREEGITYILFYDVTRFGRSWKDILSTYQELEEEGFRLIFALQPFLRRDFYEEMYRQLKEPLRSFMIETRLYEDILRFATSAEFEAVMTSMRCRSGIERAKAQGKRVGRPPVPEKVKSRIIELYNKGLTYEEIADRILQEGLYRDKKGRPRRPSLGLISKLIREAEEN